VRHREALQSGGFMVFLIFFALNAALITWSAIQVRRAILRPSPGN